MRWGVKFEDLVSEELTMQQCKDGPIRSDGEGLTLIQAAVLELQLEVFRPTKLRSTDVLLEALARLAATCQRAAEDLGLSAK